MIKPLYYQETIITEVFEKFKTYDKLMLQSMTGSGKTFTSGFIIREFVKQNKVLVAVHKEELLYQFEETLVLLGLTCEIITSKKKRLSHHADVYIGMQKTLTNRIRDNKYFLKPLSLIVVDEAHYLGYLDIFSLYPNIKKLALSATPCILGSDTFYKCDCCSTEYTELKDCCGQEVMEWTRPKTMSKYFDEIVVGPKPSTLIEFGQIVPEFNVIVSTDLSTLKTDASGEFTNQSIKETFSNEKVIQNVLINYETYCLNKKTIIFNANTESNNLVYEQFKEKGYNARMFDSVNTPNASKVEVLDWLKNTPNAVLLNVGGMIAGTDVRDIEAIILNYATNSLSKFIQSSGRGCRSCDWIFKDKFISVDLGGNFERHNSFSDDSRDWRKIFFNGLGKTSAKKEPIENVRECVNCSALTSRANAECEICGYVEPKKEVEKNVVVSDEIAKPISTPQPPNPKKIIEFVKRKEGDMNLAFKIFIEQVVMLFRFHQVTPQLYESTKRNGKFDKKINDMGRKFYFQLIASDLPQRKNVKLDTFLNKIKNKVASLYE